MSRSLASRVLRASSAVALGAVLLTSSSVAQGLPGAAGVYAQNNNQPVQGNPYLQQPAPAVGAGSLPAPQSAPPQLTPPANIQNPQENVAQPNTTKDRARLRRNVTLADVQGHSGDIYLQGTYAKYTIPLPVSRRFNVLTAKLRLSTVNSVALVAKRSSMSVSLNGYPVYQTVLDGENPAQVVDIDLPPNRFERGYTPNEIEISLAMHYTEDACEAPYSPELWTQIDPFGSTFSLEAEPVRVLSEASTGRLNLDGLYLFMEQAPWYPQKVHMVFPGSGGGALTDDHLAYGALMAQAVALRQKDVMALEMSYGTNYDHESDNVIVGSKSDIAGLLDSKELSLINGPYISIKQNAQNSTRFILVVSGNSPQDIRNALAGLGYALVKGGLPAQDFWQVEPKFYQIQPVQGDPKTLQEGKFGNPLLLNTPTVQGGGVHYFSSLGMGERPFGSVGLNYGSVPLRFYLPGDFFVRPDEHVKLVLKYTVGRGLGAGSVINITANGTPAGAMDLFLAQDTKEMRADQSASVYSRGRTIDIPASVLRPGLNVVEVQPRLFPKQQGYCTNFQTENLTFGLSPLSEMILPEYDRFTQLPDLQLVDHTGFPLSRGVNGADLSIFVPERSAPAVISAWLYFANLVQKAGTPLHNAAFSFSLSEARRQLLVVGSANFLGEDIMKNSPITADEVRSGRMPSHLALTPIEKKEDGLDSMMGWLGYTRTDEVDRLTVPFGLISDRSKGDVLTPADSGMMVQYHSPFSPGSSVVLLTAQTPEKLLDAVKRLVTDRSRERLQGDLVLWDPNSKELRIDSYRFGEPYNLGTFAPAKFFFFDKPNMFTVILIGAIGAFALVTFVILRRLGKAERA